MAVVAYAHSTTYTDTGAKDLFKVDQFKDGALATIKGGASDVYTVEFQMDSTSQRVAAQNYVSKSGDVQFYVPPSTYAVGLNIATNASGGIILDLKPFIN